MNERDTTETIERDRPGFSDLARRATSVNAEHVRVVAKVIYDVVFLPGEELDGSIMPQFEEAEREQVGGYERAVEAAQVILGQTLQQARLSHLNADIAGPQFGKN